jgi:hypothetical protein
MNKKDIVGRAIKLKEGMRLHKERIQIEGRQEGNIFEN